MGRKMQQSHQTGGVPQFPGRHPGCMWGILHVLKYQRWRYIKKRLPHRRPSANLDDNDQNPIGINGEGGYEDNYGWKGISETQTKPESGFDNQTLDGDEKPTKSTSSTKTSVRSRLKSLISDELYRKKDSRHRRSYTCPVPQQKQPPQPQPQPHHHATFEPQSQVEVQKPLPLRPPVVENLTSSPTSISLTTSHVDVKKDGESENHYFNTAKSLIPDQEKKFDEDDGSNSKEISNALDMAIMNKEFLATILQDPHSHFAPQFTSRKTKYSKSMSFPTTSLNSSLKEPPQKQHGEGKSNEAEKIAPKQLESPLLESRSYARSRSMSTTTIEHRADGISQLKQSMAALFNTSSSLIRVRGSSARNKTTMRYLKDFKQKIRHVITMEAVLHKIPHGSGGDSDNEKMTSASASSKQLPSPGNKKEGRKENILMMSPRKSCEGDSCKFLLASKSETQRLKRTSSLCESLDKYCQLYECTFNKGHTGMSVTKNTDDSPILLPLSKSHAKDDQLKSVNGALDDLGSQTLHVVEDQVVTSPITLEETIPSIQSDVETTDDDKVVSSTTDDLIVIENEKKKEEEEEQITPVFESLEEPNKDLVDESIFVMNDDASISQEETISSPTTFSTFKDSERILRNLIANKLNFLEDQRAESIIDEIIVAEEELDENNEFESNNNQANYEAIEFQVDPKEKTKFDYVRGILDTSGFSGKELLGTWHSSDQPVDPAVFEEAGVENYCHHHLAMFDLINEVLMEIYAKSHTYCPKPLSWLSHIRPMPVGSHVLKEVWGNVKWSLSSVPDENEHLLDYLVSRDFGRTDGWMNLQFDCECVGLELEDWIFDDLLDELVFEDDPKGFTFR